MQDGVSSPHLGFQKHQGTAEGLHLLAQDQNLRFKFHLFVTIRLEMKA